MLALKKVRAEQYNVFEHITPAQMNHHLHNQLSLASPAIKVYPKKPSFSSVFNILESQTGTIDIADSHLSHEKLRL
jgi:hypothetical protein